MIISGHLIPAGTGLKEYQDIVVGSPQVFLRNAST